MPWRSIELALCPNPGIAVELALVVEVEVNLSEGVSVREPTLLLVCLGVARVPR